MQPARINTPLRRALHEDGRKQAWLADRLDVDARQVWGWVHGIHIPEVRTQGRIAALLGRSVHELFPMVHDLPTDGSVRSSDPEVEAA